MPQDIFSLKHTVKELNDLLSGAKVNRITEPNSDEVVLTLYNKKVYNLILSTFAKFSRISLTNLAKENPTVAPNFCMLLRKYLSGAEITGFELLNEDRIVQINLKNKNDFKEENSYQLIIEIMNKYSNLFLVKNGIILGLLKQQTGTLDSKRLLFTGSKYLPPIKQNKLSVYTANLGEVFNEKSTITGNYILNTFDTFSPITAEELAYRINENRNKINPENVVEEFLNSLTKPNIIEGVIEVFPVNYSHLTGKRKYFNSYLEAQAEFYDHEEKEKAIKSQKNALTQKINSFLKKENKKLNLLLDRENESNSADKFRIYGELITNNIYNLKRGQKSANLFNYYINDYVQVPLQEDLSPQDNAKKYFKKYNKLKNALSITLKQKEETLNEINYLNSLLLSVNIAENLLDLKDVSNELITQNPTNKSNKQQKDKPSFLEYNVNGFKVLVGKNNIQNERLLTLANKDDLWLHAKDYHSSFLIIFSNGKDIPCETLKICGEICAYYSQGRNGDKIEIVYTLRKNVKKPPKSKCGQVIYSNYKSLSVSPNVNEELKTK